MVRNIIIKYLEAFVSKKYWEYKFIALLVVFIFITSFPSYYDLKDPHQLNYQAEHLLEPLPDYYLYGSHEQKHAYRLFVPLLCKITGLHSYYALIIQYLSALLLLYFTLAFSRKILKDDVNALLITFCTACIYAIKLGFYDVFWHFDNVAILMLVLAMYYQNPAVVFACILAASFTDERALIASVFVFIYKSIPQNYSRIGVRLPPKSALPVVLAWGSYILTRLLLIFFLDFKTGTDDIGLLVFLKNYNIVPLSFLFSFEGLWLVIAIAFYQFFKKGHYFILVQSLISILIVFTVAWFVFDVSRSTSYLFPLLFIALTGLKDEKTQVIRGYLLTAALICFVVPTEEFFDCKIFWLGPMFPKILKFL